MHDSTMPLVTYEELAHQAANETLSISVGVQVLSTIPKSQLSPEHVRALRILEESSIRLVDLIETMKSIELIS